MVKRSVKKNASSSGSRYLSRTGLLIYLIIETFASVGPSSGDLNYQADADKIIYLSIEAKIQHVGRTDARAKNDRCRWSFSIMHQRVYFFFVNPYNKEKSLTLPMIVQTKQDDFSHIYRTINDAASAYKGVIPMDMWHEPYMSEAELRNQIDDGVQFWCYRDNGHIAGVMGIQDKSDVTLIRHAYVRTSERNKGIGGELLRHLSELTTKPILIGTWADASWAINFYKKHDFQLVSFEEKEELLRKYWSISLRQIETSVVLASSNW